MQHPNIVKFFRSFCSNDYNRVDLTKPNYYDNGYVVATDAEILVIMHDPEFDKSDCFNSRLDAFSVLSPFSVCYQGKRYPIGTLKLSDFEDVFVQIQKLPEYENKYADCPICNGEAVVECDCCGHESDCENCDGEGVVVVGKDETGHYRFPDDHRFVVNGVSLGLRVTNKLCEKLKLIDAKELEVFDGMDNCRIFYRVKDTNIYILQMGLMDSDNTTTYDIKLTSYK